MTVDVVWMQKINPLKYLPDRSLQAYFKIVLFVMWSAFHIAAYWGGILGGYSIWKSIILHLSLIIPTIITHAGFRGAEEYGHDWLIKWRSEFDNWEACTKNSIHCNMIKLTKDEEVFHLTLDNGENRWNTNLVREISSVIDEIETSKGPHLHSHHLIQSSFQMAGFNWIKSAPNDRSDFTTEFMTLMGRIISLSVPSICVINGHAFGAGFMLALTHDVRYMRKDRGFMCANEIEIGMVIPDPEIALFKHKLPANVFFETVH